MLLSPRYEGPPIVSISGPPDDQLVPATRQRRRLEALLAGLSEDEWGAASRCDGWTIRDVVAHIVGVNAFWHASLTAGLAGTPTRILAAFDPVATPDLMVTQMRGRTSGELLDQLVRTNDAFVDAMRDLDGGGWAMLAEAPPGHLPIRLVVQHALWDCWIHERDIAIPLGLTPPTEPDEVRSCLVYAAALGPALTIIGGHRIIGELALQSTDPAYSCLLEVDDTVVVRTDCPASRAPCLEGGGVALLEALSFRAPFPGKIPVEWQQVLDGFAQVFTAGVTNGP